MMVRRSELYIVCYDICGPESDRRLRKVYRTLRAYGDHLQYSVFRCSLTDRKLAQLESDLEHIIDHRQDQVMIVPLGPSESASSWRMYTLGVPFDAPERVVRIM